MSDALADAGQRAEEGSGFQSNHIFLNGPGGDSISPFSGDAETVISIGPTLKAGGGLELGLTLHHSTKLWTVWDSSNSRQFLKRQGPFGLGWKLHLGRIYGSCRNGCGQAQNNWIYESSDGAQHPLEFNTGLTYNGTTDSTYIRAERYLTDPATPIPPSDPGFGSHAGGWRLFMGNGVVYTLARILEIDDPLNHTTTLDPSDDFRGWYTTSIERWDTPGHAVGRILVTYETGAKAHCIQKIEFLAPDASAVLAVQRSITFTNATQVGGTTVEGGVTTAISFPAVDGQTASTAPYTFQYLPPRTLTFAPSGGPSATANNQFLLEKITFPQPTGQATAYTMQFVYDQNTGDLGMRRLPTGATIEYLYSNYSYESWALITHLREVTQKKLHLDASLSLSTYPTPASVIPAGTWSYSRFRGTMAHPTRATVKDPLNNETVYVFGATECPYNCEASWNASLATSVKVYKGLETGGQLLRTHKTRYTADFYETGVNILPSAEWTVFHDEQGKLSGTRRLNRGPYGHFQTISEFGFVGVSVAGELPVDEVPYRQTTLTYDEVDPTNTAAARWKLWFINKMTSQVVSDGAGTPIRKTTSEYTDDGRPIRQRAFSDPAGTDPDAPENLVTEYIYANPATGTANLERSYTHKGGDSVGYGSQLEYLNNVFLKTSRVLKADAPTGSLMAFTYPSKDLVRETTSGAIIATIDPTGVRTDLYFDILGRLTKIAPTTDATEISTDISYPSIQQTVVKRGTDSSLASAYTEATYNYDTLGRLIETRRKTETGCEAIQQTRYDIVGRAEFVTEWGFRATPACPAPQLVGSQSFDANKGTAYDYWTGPVTAKVYDPLGRLQKVTSADGKSTTSVYAGAGTTVTIGTVDGQPSSTYYKRDAFGNLVVVDAPVGADGRYTYSIVGELLKVELLKGADPTVIQPRSFVYDALGRMKSSTNPESGTVQLTKYDAVGRLREKLDSDGTKFTFTYDAAGRIETSTAAEDTTDPTAAPSAPRVYASPHNLAQHFYDEAGVTRGAGRLTRVDSYDETGALLSRRKFDYAGRNGRLSEEATTFALWDGRDGIDATRDKELKTCYSYDTLGLLTSFRYPAAAACSQSPAPVDTAVLSYTYKYGALDSIKDSNRGNKDLIKSVIYNAAGGIRQILHGNNRATSVMPDIMSRPDSINVLIDPNGPNDWTNSLFRTGQYAFDGAGNILSIGPSTSDPSSKDVFHYDLLSRLTSAKVNYFDTSSVRHDYDLTYQFDDYGNLTPLTKLHDLVSQGVPSMTTSQTTNRLTAFNGLSQNYDQRGNLLGDTNKGYLFDERNRLLAVQEDPKTFVVGQYAYDAGGQRIMKAKPGTGERIFYVRDGGGNVLSEFTMPPAKYDEFYQKDYFYALGRVIGMAEEKSPSPVQGFYGSDSWQLLGDPALWGGPQQEISGNITLYWAANAEPNVKYRILRKQGTSGAWVQVAELAAGTITYTEIVEGLGFPTFFYRVAAYDPATGLPGLEGIPSRTLRFQYSLSTVATPSGVTLQKRDRSLTLRWQRILEDSGYTGSQSDPATAFQGYQVYRQNSSGGWDKKNLVPLTETVFHDLDVVPGTTYVYQVRAVSTAWVESAGSLTTSGQPGDDAPPAPPTGVRVLPGRKAGEVTVVWNHSAEPDLAEYRVYQKQAGNYIALSPSVGPTALREFTMAGLATGQLHTFAVAAKDAISYSAMSSDASARPRVAIPATPGSQVPDRKLLWSDSRGRVLLSWGSVTSASKYKVYRKLDEDPWSSYTSIWSDASLTQYTDASIDWCRAYTYMVRAADASNDESADPNEEHFVERMLRPNKPTATGSGGNSIVLNWGGLNECTPAGNGFEIDDWIIKRNLDPNYDVVISDPSVTTYTFPATAGQKYAFAIVAKVRNLYHWADTADELRLFDSFISEDICSSTTVGDYGEDPACADLALNNPTGGGGGEPPIEDEQPAKRVPPHWHRNALALPGMEEPLERIASFTAPLSGYSHTQSDQAGHLHGLAFVESPRPDRNLLAASTPVQLGISELDRIESGADSAARGVSRLTAASHGEAASSYRLIGAPSLKTFRFSYFHWDHLGSVRLVTSDAGAKIAESKFLPFGEEILGTGWPGNSHQFTGHERDSENGLDYMFARYYSPAISRFATTDPLPANNLYAYVYGSPVTLSDPSGMTPGGNPHMAEDEASRNEAWGHDPEASGLGSTFDQMLNNAQAHKDGSELPDNTSDSSEQPQHLARDDKGNGGDEEGEDDPPGERIIVTAPRPSEFFARSAEAATRAFVEAISKPIASFFGGGGNGNLWGKYEAQDGLCSVPLCGRFMDEQPMTRGGCMGHDACYDTHECNATSWLAPWRTRECQGCNWAVTMTMIWNAIPPYMP